MDAWRPAAKGPRLTHRGAWFAAWRQLQQAAAIEALQQFAPNHRIANKSVADQIPLELAKPAKRPCLTHHGAWFAAWRQLQQVRGALQSRWSCGSISRRSLRRGP